MAILLILSLLILLSSVIAAVAAIHTLFREGDYSGMSEREFTETFGKVGNDMQFERHNPKLGEKCKDCLEVIKSECLSLGGRILCNQCGEKRVYRYFFHKPYEYE